MNREIEKNGKKLKKFSEIFIKMAPDFSKTTVNSIKIYRKFRRWGTIQMINEVKANEDRSLIKELLIFLGYCEYFEKFELGGLYCFAYGLKKYFLHFFFLKLLANPKILIWT